MRKQNPEDTIVIEELESNPERFVRNLTKLANIVLHKHYGFVRDKFLKEDLVQEALMKAIELCRDGKFDESRSNLRNYLYTGMRNQMQNFFYKNSRDIAVEEVREDIEDPCQTPDEYDIEDDRDNKAILNSGLLEDICSQFYDVGNFYDEAVKALNEIGIKGKVLNVLCEETSKSIVTAIVVEYIWRICNEYG